MFRRTVLYLFPWWWYARSPKWRVIRQVARDEYIWCALSCLQNKQTAFILPSLLCGMAFLLGACLIESNYWLFIASPRGSPKTSINNQFVVTYDKINSLWRKITAVDSQFWIGVVLQNWEDCVAHTTAQLKDSFCRRISQFWKLSEEPVPIFEEAVLKIWFSR